MREFEMLAFLELNDEQKIAVFLSLFLSLSLSLSIYIYCII